MGTVKSLAKDTAVYGISSIVGRFLNWMLVPLYTNVFSTSEYGVVTYVYSVVALVMVLLTYGMETGFFRFANDERFSGSKIVYSTALTSLSVSSAVFIALTVIFLSPITGWMECEGHPSYVVLMAVCVSVDAFSTIPFSYLRYRHRPIRFAIVKLAGIAVNIGLNLFLY
ncbi:MAG: oligosaccharide flippase family protein [Paramuribaculum sp.]|nr:oligosaccharide flippase family protein [Paramuribaculum sp.]